LTELIAKVKALEVDLINREKRFLEEELAVEEPVFVFVNGQHLVTLIASPTMKKELALGHLVAEGLIDSLKEVKKVQVEGSKVKITLTKALDYEHKTSKLITPVVDTASGATSPDFLKVLDGIREKIVRSKTRFALSKVHKMMCDFDKKGGVHRKTRGTHSAAIFRFDGKLVSFTEDVGRHNAVDKAIGCALSVLEDFSETALFSSGRQPAYMVLKAARARIPIVVSIACPLESGVRAAEKAGLTLVHISGRLMKVYTNPERLEFSL